MKYKVAFTSGIWKTLEADHTVFDERTVAFIRGGRPILIASMANVCYRHIDEPQPFPLSAQCGCASVSA
jgi:hypothetical protein